MTICSVSYSSYHIVVSMDNNNVHVTDKLSNNSISTESNLAATRSIFGTTRQIPEIHDIDCVCSSCIEVCSSMTYSEWCIRYEDPSLPTVNGIIDQLYEVRDDIIPKLLTHLVQICFK